MSSRRNAVVLVLSAALQQSSPAPTLVAGAGSGWWHALAAGACASHHVRHSRAAFCPAASVMTIHSTAVCNTGCSLCQDSKKEATTRGRRSRRREQVLSISSRLRSSAGGIPPPGAENPPNRSSRQPPRVPEGQHDDSRSPRKRLSNSEHLDVGRLRAEAARPFSTPV